MTLGKVIGTIVSTVKHEAYHATKIMIVQPLGWDLQPRGSSTIAVDTVGAGEGETVLVLREGQVAKELLGGKRVPVRSVIVGIVDQVDIGPKT
ncbi:MAG: EutN/CcmL family microcompartment protein [Candidatus Latescibacterota bacterium]